MDNIKEMKTGYASIDQPWLKQYHHYDSTKPLLNVSNGSVWDVTEEYLKKNTDVPLIEYFGKIISREEFSNYVELWARTFRALGVSKGDHISLYVLATPESYAMFFAANAIGAIPYYQKLSITKEELQKETQDAKIAVVFDVLWDNVRSVFRRDRFKNVIVTTAADSMMIPLKQLTKMKNYFYDKKIRYEVSDSYKYLWTDDALKFAKHYTGDYKVTASFDDIAIITTSSGTTSHNVKGIMDTNRGVLSSVFSFMNAETKYEKGKRTLTCFPPTASTSINTLHLVPTLTGGTIIFDPRVDSNLWYKQLMKYKPDITVSTGSVWETFVNEVLEREKNGKKHDLSWIDFFILGGSGATPEVLKKINSVLKAHGAKRDINVGYGLSEVFGPLTLTKYDSEYRYNEGQPVISVGVPLPGYIVGIFDHNGNELPYGKGFRGELWIKSPANMHGYYKKKELTDETSINGWIHTGDLCEIDDNGNIYCYGRMKSKIEVNNQERYLFDIANNVREKFNLHDINIETKDLTNGSTTIVIYFVQEEKFQRESKELIKEIDEYLAKDGIVISGYKEFIVALPIDPTTLKPRTKDIDGFIKYDGDDLYEVSYDEISLDKYVENNKKVNTKVLTR